MKQKSEPKFAVIEGAGVDTFPCGCENMSVIDTQEVEYSGGGTTHYLPSEFYYRQAVRRTINPLELQAIALAVIAEHQRLKEWMRRQIGVVPPKWTVHQDEAEDRGMEVLP